MSESPYIGGWKSINGALDSRDVSNAAYDFEVCGVSEITHNGKIAYQGHMTDGAISPVFEHKFQAKIWCDDRAREWSIHLMLNQKSIGAQVRTELKLQDKVRRDNWARTLENPVF